MAAILLCGLLWASPAYASAGVADDPSLVIGQFKITSHDGQFITLYNTTDSALDMSDYGVEYFNNYDPADATSSRLIALSGTVPPHGYFMVNDDSLFLCYRLTVDSTSLGLSSTSGFIEVVKSDRPGSAGPVTSTVEDYVGWSKRTVSGAQTLPYDTAEFLQRQPLDTTGAPAVTVPGAGSWLTVRHDDKDPCGLIGYGPGGPAPVPTGPGLMKAPADPPATVIGADRNEQASAGPSLPAHDMGLRVPTVSELLPNPAGTGNDKTDEFIELYNSNSTTFDLSGFTLQTGTTSLHTFRFPARTILQPRSFKAFYSAKTGLSLSNSGGQVKLLDPFGNSISASGAYGKAKDGVAWALAKGKWYWTTSPTPGKANIIKIPPSKAKKSSRTKGSKNGKAAGAYGSGTTNAASSGSGRPSDSPIHLGTLVLVAALALLYGLYEYRADLANHVYKFRQHFGARYEDRA